jgi:3'-phosphoadenosine 5'-phosphosulfate sulfotransferase (PAPS reductase)/FAD synthetase
MLEVALNNHTDFSIITENLRTLYLNDSRPWLVGFSGGKDSTLVAALVFETVLSIFAFDKRWFGRSNQYPRR